MSNLAFHWAQLRIQQHYAEAMDYADTQEEADELRQNMEAELNELPDYFND